MKTYKITVHSDDLVCIVTANDEDDAEQKYIKGEIDEWIAGSEYEQSDMKVEEIKNET
ncbi:hypothetical protein LCGC14_3009650 [marine sediment metagenome]|uniref:Uncharacterized protein n=1 Tax=marine sediment metagenome TaxID=412755 RepID=A0A0F8WZ32_9ZZZZ